MGFMGFVWDLWDLDLWDLSGIYGIYSKGVRDFFSDLPLVKNGRKGEGEFFVRLCYETYRRSDNGM